MAYPGELARQHCASATRAEFIEYVPHRPLALRDETRLKWQNARCGRCGACPLMIRALAIMLPARERSEAVVLRLAG